MLRPSWQELFKELQKIKGGYRYDGACSIQICFPLRSGGELRFSVSDDDADPDEFCIDLYDGSLPPCITGPSFLTGEES